MSSELPVSAVLKNRYEILCLLGRGGFSFTYKAFDHLTHSEVIIKELAPQGCTRNRDGSLSFANDGEEILMMIRRFLDEARLLARLRIPGVVAIKDAFQGNGTAYMIMEFLPNAEPLSDVLRKGGILPIQRVITILRNAAKILHDVHSAGFLHRDIKPSNILIDAKDNVTLIDFGAVREWHADTTVKHTILFTPGYAPIEQLAERGRRGPASDLYSLAATGYEMLVGKKPPSALERLNGVPLPPLRALREDIPYALELAITKSLEVHASKRPQSAEDFLALLSPLFPSENVEQPPSQHAVVSISEVDVMDAKLVQLKKLRIPFKSCPSCGGELEEVKPLKPNVCPVCHVGKVVFRDLDPSRCAICRTGILHLVKNFPLLSYCPLCKFGHLQKISLISKRLNCDHCNVHFERRGKNKLALLKFGLLHSELIQEGAEIEESKWLSISGRSEKCLECESCHSQWDIREDGRLLLVYAKEDVHRIMEKYRLLTPEEWARVALGLPTDAGNSICKTCGAEFYRDEDSLTLLDVENDPYEFFEKHGGRRIPLEEVPWVAVGKNSGMPGLLCKECGLEFDFDGDYLRLKDTNDPSLRFHINKAFPLEDWHRIARNLPTTDEENAFLEEFEHAIRREIWNGDVLWDDKDKTLRWTSKAMLLEETEEGFEVQSKGKVTVRNGKLRYRYGFRSWQIPVDSILFAENEENLLKLRIAGKPQTLVFEIEPVELSVDLRSGTRTLMLGSFDLKEILTRSAAAGIKNI